MDKEGVTMKLIMYGGDARALSFKAIDAAEGGDFKVAEQLLKDARKAISHAHEAQTQLIQQEINSEDSFPINLLMVHAQDHVMNAMTVCELAEHLVKNTRLIFELKKQMV